MIARGNWRDALRTLDNQLAFNAPEALLLRRLSAKGPADQRATGRPRRVPTAAKMSLRLHLSSSLWEDSWNLAQKSEMYNTGSGQRACDKSLTSLNSFHMVSHILTKSRSPGVGLQVNRAMPQHPYPRHCLRFAAVVTLAAEHHRQQVGARVTFLYGSAQASPPRQPTVAPADTAGSSATVMTWNIAQDRGGTVGTGK